MEDFFTLPLLPLSFYYLWRRWTRKLFQLSQWSFIPLTSFWWHFIHSSIEIIILPRSEYIRVPFLLSTNVIAKCSDDVNYTVLSIYQRFAGSKSSRRGLNIWTTVDIILSLLLRCKVKVAINLALNEAVVNTSQRYNGNECCDRFVETAATASTPSSFATLFQGHSGREAGYVPSAAKLTTVLNEAFSCKMSTHLLLRLSVEATINLRGQLILTANNRSVLHA